MRIDANPIQLLREVFKPLPPTAELDAPEGEDNKDSVLDAVVISDMARILAEQKDAAQTAETDESEETTSPLIGDDESDTVEGEASPPAAAELNALQAEAEAEPVEAESEEAAAVTIPIEQEEAQVREEEPVEEAEVAEPVAEDTPAPQATTISLEQSA